MSHQSARGAIGSEPEAPAGAWRLHSGAEQKVSAAILPGWVLCFGVFVASGGLFSTTAADSGRSTKTSSAVFTSLATTNAGPVTAPSPVTQSGTGRSLGIPSTNTLDLLDTAHKLAIGDRLSFRIEEDLEEPKPLVVADSGELEVPYIGRVPAEGKTCKQLAGEIKAALEKDYYYHAAVVLALDQKAKSLGKVYIVGPVRIPGPQEIPSDEVLTLSKAILRAGGFNDFADRHNVKVTRQSAGSAGGKQILVVDVAQIFDKGKLELDLKLEPGDLILVPERLVRF